MPGAGRWYQFTVGQLLILTTVLAMVLAILVQWPLAILIPAASVILASPIGVPLYFVGTMLNDKKTCTARFLLVFFVSECIAVMVVFVFLGLMLLLTIRE